MAGAAKRRMAKERSEKSSSSVPVGRGSTSGDTSSSGKANSSAKTQSRSRSHRSAASHRAGYDGNRDPAEPSSGKSRVVVDNPKNLDLGTMAWGVVRGYDVTIPRRPPPSTLGQPVKVGLNTFNVEAFPQDAIYQFEVTVGNGNEKRGLISKVWESKAVISKIGKGYIFDGNKLAWGKKEIRDEVRIMVDLDAEQGRVPKPGKENKHRFVMRQTNRVRIDVLMAYLNGKCDFDNNVLESINFLDHQLREHPRNKYTQIKRSFFARGEKRFELGNAVEAFKGVYQSMRIVNTGNGPARLSINLDVSNGTFWTQSMLVQAAVQLTNSRDVNMLLQGLRASGETGRQGKELKKLRKLHVTAKHRGDQEDRYVIDKLVWKSARDHTFENKNGKKVSVYQYLSDEYNVRLQYPDLPLVKMTKGQSTLLPMEVLSIEQNQRYPFKLDEKQTSNMIKFAVTPPPQRWQAIEHGLDMLDWAKDPVLAHFGTKISRNRVSVEGRLLVAPKVQFGKGDARPGTSGRWDLKGKTLLLPNPEVLKRWGVCVISGRRGGKPDRSVVQNFLTEFIKTYISHGGRVENRTPFITLASGDDVGAWVTQTWNGAGNQGNGRPQMLMFILPDKDSTTYGRIKRSGECRYGVVTQCVQYAHVMKCQGQYMSNVCLKFNAKLGGTTARAIGAKSSGPNGHHAVPTCIIGADVSHAAPGTQTASMAAITMSMDRLGIRYSAACDTNGFRQEMIMPDNIENLIKPMFKDWVDKVGQGKMPERIIYFRDGVSEGQYAHVLDQEVKDMKKLIRTSDPKSNIPFIVLIGSKRHHVRFFPDKGDRNGNPFPGTLVETGVTHPYENDFYLNSHAAIKGTARPMHYHVLLNEAKISNEELQTMIYEQCYQYMRATTPVSQHPAIYYAHIASNRAIPHDPRWGGSNEPGAPGGPGKAPPPKASGGSASGSQSKGQGKSGGHGSSSGMPSGDAEKLLPMPEQGGIRQSMWYI